MGQAVPGFATYLSHAGEKSFLATLRKSWYSRTERRARSASNSGVQSKVNYFVRFFFRTLSMAARKPSTVFMPMWSAST